MWGYNLKSNFYNFIFVTGYRGIIRTITERSGCSRTSPGDSQARGGDHETRDRNCTGICWGRIKSTSR